tara:strand:+ start:820 stop:1467 length:648 start_codon:yes stop_codon:yes gene_type:complete
MAENLFETSYDITKKSRLRRFYDSNKIFIFSALLISFICLGSFFYYLESQKKEKIRLSENYIKAKIYIEGKNNEQALKTIKEIINANDSTYSTLAFFLILDANLISDKREIIKLFDHLLSNNKYDKELKNLLIFKKIMFSTGSVTESELLQTSKTLLNSETLWKPHLLLLLGDYFVSKNEKLKAKEFYGQILTIKNLRQDFYENAQSKLRLIAND